MIECAHRRRGELVLARKHKLGVLAGNVTAKARIFLAVAINRQIEPRIEIDTCARPSMLANKIEEVVIHGRSIAALGPARRTVAKTHLHTPLASRT